MSAQKVAYHGDVIHCGPIYQSMKVKKNKIILSFDTYGSAIAIKGGDDLMEFAIGVDKQFVWAKAKIKGDKIEVWSDEVDKPVAVRYAWANNLDKANLFNSEGYANISF